MKQLIKLLLAFVNKQLFILRYDMGSWNDMM